MMGGNTAVVTAGERRLLTCLRWDQRGDAALAGLTESDWSALVAALRERRGLHFLSRRLDSGVGATPPRWVVETLRAQAQVTVARMFQTIENLRPCFAEIDHPVLALKGLDLAHRIYPHPGVRPMGDFDLLVSPRHVIAMDIVLRRHGYRRDGRLDDAVIHDETTHHAFYRPSAGNGLPVELHWRLSSIAAGRDRATAPIMARSRPIAHPSLPATVRVMQTEDLFLHLCEHSAHHGFETSLTQVWDLAEVARWAGAVFDWPTFWSRAEAARLTNAVQLCLHQLENTLGVAVPPAMAMTQRRPLPTRIVECAPDVLPNLGLFYPGKDSKGSLKMAVLLNRNHTLSDWLSWAKAKTAARVEVNAIDADPPDRGRLARLVAGARFLLARRRLLWLWLIDKARVREKARRRAVILAWIVKE